MRHKIEIAPNLAICIDGKRVIGSKPQGLFLTTEMIVSDEDLKRLADRCLEVISDRKTEPQTNADQHVQHVESVKSVDNNGDIIVRSNLEPFRVAEREGE